MTKLDDMGRCCGRKPLDYTRGYGTSLQAPHKFCTRCDRSFDSDTGDQIENWAWHKGDDGEFVKGRKP